MSRVATYEPQDQPEPKPVDLGTCKWFALCDHKATRTESHPILGDVPICDRCTVKLLTINKQPTQRAGTRVR